MILGSASVLGCIYSYPWMCATHEPQVGYSWLRLREIRHLNVDNGGGEWSLLSVFDLSHYVSTSSILLLGVPECEYVVPESTSSFFLTWSWRVAILVLPPILLVESKTAKRHSNAQQLSVVYDSRKPSTIVRNMFTYIQCPLNQ